MNRLTRHIVTEILEIFLAILFGLVFIIMSFRFAALLSEAAKGKIVGSAIFKLLGLFIVNATEFLIPFAFFIAVIWVLVRFSSSGEYIAIRAIGYGYNKIRMALLAASVPIGILLLVLSFTVYPEALRLSFKLLDQAREQGETTLIRPGQFRNLGNNMILYIGEVEFNQTGATKFKRFFFIQENNEEQSIISAAEGNLSKTQVKNTEKRSLSLINGSRITSYSSGEKSGQFMQAKAEKIEYYLPEIELENRKNKIKTLSTEKLLSNRTIAAQSEIQRRTATALSIPILALLALLLISDKPRKSQYIAFAYAITIYLIYTINQTVITGLAEKERIPILPGGFTVPLVTMLIIFSISTWKRK